MWQRKFFRGRTPDPSNFRFASLIIGLECPCVPLRPPCHTIAPASLSFSAISSVLALIPLSIILRKVNIEYGSGKDRGKLKDPLLTMTLCVPNEKQDKGNIGQNGLSDNTKVDCGSPKNHG